LTDNAYHVKLNNMTGTKPPSKPSPLWVAYPEEVADVSLGEKLKLLRKEKGWSQDELAYHAQIDGRQVSRYENDRVMPSIEVILKIAKAYEMSLDYLLLDDAPRRALRAPSGKLAERVFALGTLSEEDERSIVNLLDALAARQQLRELAAKVG
jgi:transcriptional regulator with XRE-family HTH domain